MKTLRPYQSAAEKSLWKYIYDNPNKHPLVVAPVAAGKSLMIAEFIKSVHKQFPRTRVVLLTHVKELLQQDAEELFEQYVECDVGFYCAGLNQKKLHNDVTFASIQSVHNKIGNFNRIPEIIIIDECHLISHKAETRYRTFIDSVLAINPNCRVIGYTGTPFRSDTGRLDKGEGKLFDGIAYEIEMSFMIEQGYWAKPVCPDIAFKMDTTGVGMRGGDYIEGQLEKAINTKEINKTCVEELIEVGKDRKKWLVFTAGIQHANDVAEELSEHGISVAVVTGKTPAKERKQILKDYKAGVYRALVNVAVLTTGYNEPTIDLLCFMRPTRSPVLYIQIVGRGVRVVYAEGYDLDTQQGRLDAIANSVKPDCMIVDFGGVVETLGAIDTVSIRGEYTGEPETEGEGKAILKICPACGAECAAAQTYCYECSHCFINLTQKSSNKAIVSTDEEPEWHKVMSVYSVAHQKQGGYPSMKVVYGTMSGAYREWICFEHHNYEQGDNKRYAWERAVKWHRARLLNAPCPTSVEDAVNTKYPEPSKILVRRKGKYWEIIDYDFTKEEVKPLTEDEEFEIPW